MFTVKWTKSWVICRGIIRPIRESLHPVIDSHLRDKYCMAQRYCICFHDGKPCGVLKCGMHFEAGVMPQLLPFICEAGTTRKIPGAGAALFDEFVMRYGAPFWLKCLDRPARDFWIHMAEKNGLRWSVIGHTYWETPILHFEKP